MMSDFPKATAVFNCTGLGARSLGGVKDEKVFPTKVYSPRKVNKSLILILNAEPIKIGPNNAHF
jgi:hypothetical protein